MKFHHKFLKGHNLFKNLKSLYYLNRYKTYMAWDVYFKGQPKHVAIGDDFTVYKNCIFEFGPDAHFTVGLSCLLSYGVLIQNNDSIVIGDFVQVGEYTSIRDTTHSYQDIDIPIKLQKDCSQPIVIGNNVWIGKNCIIMPGTIIEDGVIIGANSLVKGHLNKNNIYGGTPLKLLSKRT